MTFIDPPNTLLRITEMWVFVSQDDEGNEGVCAAPLLGPGSYVPLIAADKARLDSLREVAAHIAAHTNKTIRLVKFYRREDVEAIEP